MAEDKKSYARQTRYDKKNGLIVKGFKIKRTLADEFKEACAAAGVSQAQVISKLMADYINQQKKKAEK